MPTLLPQDSIWVAVHVTLDTSLNGGRTAQSGLPQAHHDVTVSHASAFSLAAVSGIFHLTVVCDPGAGMHGAQRIALQKILIYFQCNILHEFGPCKEALPCILVSCAWQRTTRCRGSQFDCTLCIYTSVAWFPACHCWQIPACRCTVGAEVVVHKQDSAVCERV